MISSRFMKQLSVIIVSYNVRHYLVQTLISLCKAGQGLDMEIIVIDNMSVDGTEQLVKSLFSSEDEIPVIFINNTANEGFGKANNKALAHASGEYILFINPDTFVGEDTLKTCLDFYRKRPEAGICGVRMLNPDGSFARESRRGVPTLFSSFCRLSGLSNLFPKSRMFSGYYMGHMDENRVCPIDVASGAFMMVPRSVLEKEGAFDERFFMYGEDVELSWRIRKGGYQNYYLPVRILHYKGESTNKMSKTYINSFYQAMLLFFRKHYPQAWFLYSCIYVIIYLLAFKAAFQAVVTILLTRLGCVKELKVPYVICCSSAMVDRMERFCEEYHLEGKVINADAMKVSQCMQWVDEKDMVLVLDMNLFSYQEILEAFDNRVGKNCLIGTLYPQLNLLLTSKNTFTL